MKIVTVTPLQKGAFKEDLTYFTSKDIKNGRIVRISIRNKNILGLVVSSEDLINAKGSIKDLAFNLKKISDTKEQSVFKKEFIEGVLETGAYFACRKNNAMTALLPSAYREEYDKIEKLKNKSAEIKKIAKNLKTEKLLFQAPLEDRLILYKTLIRSSFAEKKSVFMVLPTEKDIQFFKDALGRGISDFIFSIHGGLSARKQVEQFKNIISIEHPVIIFGTAQYLSIPRKDIGTIILEHESSGAYNMMVRPYFDLRVFAELFAQKMGAKLILGDSLLRFETIARKEMDNFSELHPLSFRLNFKGAIEIAGKNSEEKKEKFQILTDDVIKEIQNTISKKENIFVFSLRRGLATVTICRDCNEPAMCKECSAPVVLYISRDGSKRMFICNKCGTEKSPETVCEMCGGWNLMPLGIGTDTVYEELKKIFPKANILKLDKESAKTAKGAEAIVKEFEESPGSILVGTEMATFYLKEKTPLSIIASFDSLWSIPNFKMSEKIIQLLFSIISKTADKLIIQTKNDRDPAILAIKNENLSAFIREELKDREKLGYPPFKRFIKVGHIGDKEEATRARRALAEVFVNYNPEIFSGFVAKLKGKYVTNALIKIDRKKWSSSALLAGSSIDQNLSEKLISLPPEFSVNIDPEDLL